MISFNATRTDRELIKKVATRAWPRVQKLYASVLDLKMDLTATHLNGCPLDLEKLLNADDLNFFHDIYGIGEHLNRKTGQLTDCFVPRCAA